MKHLGTAILETERLILRPFCVKDADDMYKNWANDAEVTKYLTWTVHENVEETRELLKEWESNYNKKDYYQWAITFKENTKKPIGSIGVVKMNEELKIVQIGYCIGQSWWNKGVTTESFDSVINYLFTEVGVNRIEAIHDVNNPNSGKVMVKCGMKHEGICRESNSNNQGICDVAIYSILRKEYIGNK